MLITVTPSKFRGLELTEIDAPLEVLKEQLSTFEIGEKDGEALIPAAFAPCPPTCRNHSRSEAMKSKGSRNAPRDCGGGVPHRLGANVTAMTALGVDLDHVGTPQELAAVLAGLSARGLRFFWWHTFSHRPASLADGVAVPADVRARILIPFARPFPLKSPAQWSKGAWPMLVKALGLDGAAAADEACKDPARVYYLPRKPSVEAVRESGFHDGAELDWAPIFGNALDGFAAAAMVVARPPQEDPTRPVDLSEVKERLKRVRQPSLHPLVKNLLAGAALVPPPSQRSANQPARYVAWRSVTAALSLVADEWMSSEALLELLRPSWLAEVQDGSGDNTPWDTIVDLFEKARASAPQKKAEREAQRQASKAMWERVLGLKHGTPPAVEEEDDLGEEGPDLDEGAGGGGGGAEPEAERGLAGDALVKRLEWLETKSGEPKLKKSLVNLAVLLRESGYWKGNIRKNLLSLMTEVWGGPCFEARATPFEIVDNDAALVRLWLAKEFDVEFDAKVVDACIELSAIDSAYDPLVDYLRGLTWDGKARLDTMLERLFAASLTTPEGEDRTGYVRAASARWMIGAVARALRPGAKLDTMLVLQGPTGARKSTAAAVLGGKFFVDFDYDLESNDARTACSENWIAEIGELASMSRTQREHVKMFLTKTFDKFRAPYARRQENHPRRIAFIGTTNDDEIFTDETGNRRFWPVTIAGKVDTDGLLAERDQLWAEAVARFDAGEQWHLTESEEAVARRETADRMRSDSYTDRIVDWLLEKEPKDRPTEIRLGDLARLALGEERVPDRAMEMRLADALRRLGFARQRPRRSGIKTVVYRTPEELLVAPRVGGASKGLTQQLSARKPASASA